MVAEDLAEAVAALPAEIRERLAGGPVKYRWGCGVCEAFGRDWYISVVPDETDPMWRAWAYHEVPKLDMKVRRDLHYGEHANAIYCRCIETYRAAGWTGEAQGANA
jgi:hypothetical protein